MEYQIDIDGEIGYWGYSKSYVKSLIEQNKGKHIDMRISSLGGSVDDALDIASRLNEHGDVTAYLYGFVASAATIISLGAKRTLMDSSAFFLIHKVMDPVCIWDYLNADDIENVIKELDEKKQTNAKIDLVLARMYAKKTNRKCSEIVDIMAKGSWLTAKEAHEYGFVDEIVHNLTIDKVNIANKLNAFGLPPLPVNEEGKRESKFQKFIHSLTNSKKMKEMTFKNICKMLNVEFVSADEDNIVKMNSSQLDAIEKHIQELEDCAVNSAEEISKLKEENEKLIEKVNSLASQSAEAPSDGKKGDADCQRISAIDMYNKVKDLI